MIEWDISIQCNQDIQNIETGIMLIDKESKTCWIVYVLCAADKKPCADEGIIIDIHDVYA